MSLRKFWEFLATQMAFLIFVIVSFYLRHRGLSFFDASDFATAIQGGGIPHAPGYPLYVLLGKFLNLFTRDPFEAQFWLNILAAWVASFFLFLTLGPQKKSALVAVLFLLGQGLFQQYILVPEVFTLNLALVSILIYFHKRFEEGASLKWALGIGCLYGLGVCHHHLMALMVPASLFLLIRGFFKIPWWKVASGATLGFVLGLLPLGYFFITTALEPDYTYYSVRSFSDLLFVVLREGYGTFKMTGSGEGVPPWDLFSFIFWGTLKSTGYVGLIGGLVALPFFWRARKPVDAVAVLVTTTLLVFVGVFCSLANFPIGNIEGQNAFLRYLSLPCFLILYPLAFGCEFLINRWGKRAWVGGFSLALGLAGISFSQLNYRHYPLVDFPIEQAFKTVERVVTTNPVPELSPGYGPCVIFALTDPFHFGGRYYNQFQAKEKCYFYSIATVITGQFQAVAEQRLLQKYLGEDFSFAGKSKEEVLFEFFSRVLKAGYRVFFISSEDLRVFQRPDILLTPVGAMVEMMGPGRQVNQANVLSEYVLYLESLQGFLRELEAASSPPKALSAHALQVPFANLNIYPQLIKLPSPYLELEKDVRRRSEEFLRRSLR